VADELLGQVLVIALPEEAFYRGYLQTRLDEVWAPRWNVLGADVGPGLIATAMIFAAGHLATVQVPARLAVFFPALLFGWLRARTGGIGASVCFHATCNVYSLMLGRGYGVY
jgi:membrane protease YdiL (CAAX protease family)